MKKIMFNDRYGLTQAVIEGRKTMTRRVIPLNLYNATDWKEIAQCNYIAVIDGDGNLHDIRRCGIYKVGEIVAVAQRYCDIYKGRVSYQDDSTLDIPMFHQGWNNKMFVRADLMPHQIRITNIRVERLQDISDEDCLREGIQNKLLQIYEFDGWPYFTYTPREAFAALIDKVSGKDTWNKNPYCFCYEFELIR